MQRLFQGLLLATAIVASPTIRMANDGPTFKGTDDLTFIVKGVEAESKVVFDPSKTSTSYSIEFEGEVTVPKDTDVVCITDRAIATKVTAGRKSLLFSEKPETTDVTDFGFNAMIDGRAETELKSLRLTANPYEISQAVIRVGAVVANRRFETSIETDVTEDMRDVGQGIRLRLSSMKIGTNRIAEVEIDYQRDADENGAFLESVHAIDARGRLLGGERWSRANRIFAPSGRFKAKFVIPPGSTIAKLKLVIVTDYKLKPIEFTIDKIFQM